MIRVAIVDDHRLFADGLTAALQAIPDIEVAATFPDGAAFLEAQARLAVDVLLLDLEMPETSGFDLLRSIPTSLAAIVVTMHATQEQRQIAFDLGAKGFLSKSTHLNDVAAAVRAVHGGSSLDLDSLTLRETLDLHRTAILDPGAASLTPRERELLSQMAHGVTATYDLAEALFISQKTVKNHLASIYEKLAISDRAQAAVEAIRLGLDRE